MDREQDTGFVWIWRGGGVRHLYDDAHEPATRPAAGFRTLCGVVTYARPNAYDKDTRHAVFPKCARCARANMALAQRTAAQAARNAVNEYQDKA